MLSIDEDKGEITITFNQKNIIESLRRLRDRPEFDFKQLIISSLYFLISD